MLKVEVTYSEKECHDDYELMQMEIPLADDCGTLSAQWLVKCDILDNGKKTMTVYDHLHIMTSQGEVVSGDDQIINVGKDLNSIDIFVS